MNRFTLAFVAAVASATMLTPTAPLQAKDKDASSVSIPVSGKALTGGGTFAGTFNLQRFVNNNGTVLAVGTIVGTVTDANGQPVGSALQTVAIPVTAGPGATAAATAALAPAVITCPILHLDLGPLDLNLLGLVIHLDEVVLDITAVPGAGNLLGNLLCGVANLLNNPAGLAALLNQILGILAGL